jgi:hypothetical protein
VCYIDLEPCEVWEENERKSRKQRSCSCCNGLIKVSEQYVSHFSVCEGEKNVESICMACHADRDVFAKHHDGTLCTPGWFSRMLIDCISEDEDSRELWGPMLERIRATRRQMAVAV